MSKEHSTFMQGSEINNKSDSPPNLIYCGIRERTINLELNLDCPTLASMVLHWKLLIVLYSRSSSRRTTVIEMTNECCWTYVCCNVSVCIEEGEVSSTLRNQVLSAW